MVLGDVLYFACGNSVLRGRRMALFSGAVRMIAVAHSMVSIGRMGRSMSFTRVRVLSETFRMLLSAKSASSAWP